MCEKEREQGERESLSEGGKEAERLVEEGRVVVGAPSLEFCHGRERRGNQERGEEKIERERVFQIGPLG